MDWFAKHRIMRRLLVSAVAYSFLRVSLHIFNDGIALDTHLAAVYGIFAGIFTLIVKFYLQGNKRQADND